VARTGSRPKKKERKQKPAIYLEKGKKTFIKKIARSNRRKNVGVGLSSRETAEKERRICRGKRRGAGARGRGDARRHYTRQGRSLGTRI